MHPQQQQPQSQQQPQQPLAPAAQMQSHLQQQQHPHPTQLPQQQGQPPLPPPQAQQQHHQQQSVPPVSQQQQQQQHPSHSHQQQSHYHEPPQHHGGHHINHHHGHPNQQMLHSQQRPQQQHMQHQHHQQHLSHHHQQQQHQSHHHPHHHHNQQQQQQQQHPQQHHTPGQHHMPPTQPNQHMIPHVPPQMIPYPPQGIMYAPTSMGHPHLFSTGGHVQHQFNHNPAVPPPPQPLQTTNNRPDQVNVSSQPSQQGQQPHQPQQPPPQQQQQQQPGSINPNNLPPHVGPMHPPVINTSTTANTGVHQVNNGSIMDSHMQHRMPLSQAPMMPYGMQYPHAYNMPHMMHYHIPQPYPAPHMPPASSAPIRLPVDMAGIRPSYDTHNHAAPVAVKVPSSQAAPIAAVKPPGSHIGIPVPPSTAPKQPLPQRERKKLAIVDPKTKHVFTDEELKGSSAKSTSSTTTPSTTNTSTLTTTTAATTTASTASPPVDITASKGESPPTTIISEQKKPSSTIEATHTSHPTPSVPSSVSEVTSTTYVSPQQSDRNVPSSSPSTISPRSPTVSVAATSVTTTIVHEQSTTTNAITKSPSTLVENMHALSVSDMKPTTQTITPIGQSAPTVNADHEDVRTDRDAVDHALSQGGEPIREEEDSKAVVQDAEDEKQQELTKKELNPAFPYEPDQYSPLNPSGRKKYTIKFLHAIGNSILPPETTNTDFMPSYMRPGPNQRYGEGYGMPRRNSQQALNNKNQPPRRIIQTQSLQPEVELKTVEKPWKPELDVEKSKAIETGEIDTQRLLKLFRGHLNKITPQKYDSIMAKVNDLDLDSDEKLKSVIDLVFDKAVDEPGFCEIYARMSKVIAAKYQRFFYHLVKKCQDEFETTDLYEGLDVESRELDIEKETDPAKKKLLTEELYEDMRLRRKKYLGTVKLIGEMYKLGLLIPKIIGMCMMRLIEEASNENIECLCSLIATVGAKMASEQEDEIKQAFKHTLTVLHDIAHSKKTEKLFTLEQRVKFKILDTIDLSKKNWKPRMEQNNPMKLEEVREEAKRESAMKQHNHAKNHPKNDDRNRRSNNSSSNSFRPRY